MTVRRSVLSADRVLTCASFEDAEKAGIDAEQLRSEYKQAYIVAREYQRNEESG